MGRPRLYATEEERRAAQRAAWQKYNKAHKQERANHNRQYCQREEVKARRRDMYRERAQQARVEDGGYALKWYDICSVDLINISSVKCQLKHSDVPVEGPCLQIRL